MKEIFAELSKPVWWVSVVIFGILINLVSGYLKTLLDETISRSSLWWRERSARRREIWARRVQAIRSSREHMEDELVKETRFRLQSIQLLLLGIFMLSLASWSDLFFEFLWLRIGALSVSALALFASYLAFMRAAEVASIVRASQVAND